jgi:hypothetical protein
MRFPSHLIRHCTGEGGTVEGRAPCCLPLTMGLSFENARLRTIALFYRHTQNPSGDGVCRLHVAVCGSALHSHLFLCNLFVYAVVRSVIIDHNSAEPPSGIIFIQIKHCSH